MEALTSVAAAAPTTLADRRIAARALPVLVFMLVLVLPGVAGARKHEVSLDRGEIAITYDGTASTNVSTGAYCQGTNPCVAFGKETNSLGWVTTAIADLSGHIGADDTALDANGEISVNPYIGAPAGAALAPATQCDNTVRERGRYEDGAAVTHTRRSIGVQVELPFSLKWLTVSGDPDHCQLSATDWAGSVLSLGSAGPTSKADVAKLELALRPKMGAPRSARRTTKEFNFDFMHDTGTGPYGVWKIYIHSTVTVLSGCKRFDTDTGHCATYYG
jgi:hypothetical protein